VRLSPQRRSPVLFLRGAAVWLGAAVGLAAVSPGGRGRVLRRLRDRGRTGAEPGQVPELPDDGDPQPRLIAALEQATTAHEAADALLDEVSGRPGAEIAGIVLVDERGERARGLRARGVDEAWWRGISIDLVHETGAVANVVRDRTPFAVYDVTAAPNVNASLAEAVGAKSVAFVPLVSDGVCVAVLVLASTAERRFFSSAELEAIARLADEAAPVIERLRSEVALRSALEREKLVAEIARKVRSELDIDDVLQVAVAETGRGLGVARCFVRLGLESDPEPLRVEWRRPGVEPITDATRLTVANLAAREGRTIAIADVEGAAELDDPSLGGRDALIGAGVKSALATPIVVFDRTIGVFGLQRTETGAWSGSDIAVAEAVAGELGIAIHAARLLEEDERRLGLQGALLKAAQVVTSDLRFESVLRRLVDEVAVLFGADAADCWMFEPGSQVLRCRAVYGLDEERDLGRRVPVQGTHAQAIETGRPVLTRDVAGTEAPAPRDTYAGFEEVMVAPMIWLGEVRGVLGVCSREAERFDSSEVEILDAFARFASLASHNAESFEERARQARIQRGFYRIAEVLGSSLSLAETRDALANAAADALGGEAAAVLELRGDSLVCAGSYRLPPALTQALESGVPVDASPLAAAAVEGRTVASQDLAGDERFDPGVKRLLGVPDHAALLAAPVVREGENQVVVVLFRDRRSFSEEDLALTRQLSGAARGALERAEHFESVSRARRLSEVLAALGARLVSTLSPEDVLKEAATEARTLIGADAAVVRLLEEDELVVRAAAGAAVEPLLETAASSGQGLLGDVAQSRRLIAVPDVRAAPDAGRGDAILGDGMQAGVAVPLVGRDGGLRGVLSAYSAAPRAWRPDETQALVALAALVSAALSNAELYRDVAEEKERSEAILANIADGIVAVDREGTIVLWNSMAEQITGVQAGDALGRRLADTLQRDLTSGEEEAAGEREVTIARGGKEVWLALTEAAMRDASGNVGGRIFAFRDVSSERAVEEMKSDFVATVSHELRTPLTSIYGFAETLLRADIAFDERERATFLSTIASESERLIRIVDDLLNVARLEAGMLGLAVQPTDLGEVIRAEVGRVEAGLDRRHTLAVDLDDDLNVDADPDRVAQVLHHLVDNAVKFSPSGGTITIVGRRRNDTVELRVRDEGVGLSPVERQRVFTKFFRGGTGEEVAAHGTGLGLFLARGLVVAMGGRMWLESDEGHGSTFAFELPVTRAPEPVEA
jgi:PAS domain S-box-containing protein